MSEESNYRPLGVNSSVLTERTEEDEALSEELDSKGKIEDLEGKVMDLANAGVMSSLDIAEKNREDAQWMTDRIKTSGNATVKEVVVKKEKRNIEYYYFALPSDGKKFTNIVNDPEISIVKEIEKLKDDGSLVIHLVVERSTT